MVFNKGIFQRMAGILSLPARPTAGSASAGQESDANCLNFVNLRKITKDFSKSGEIRRNL